VTNGFLLIQKSSGITSARVVQKIKSKFKFKKVGHLGTLDPMADGLLILAINRATKFANLLLESDKSYFATVSLGSRTDTDDAEGQIIETLPVLRNAYEIEDALMGFVGENMQTPPIYSALKFEGKPLYKYAREGRPIQKDPRKIIVHSIDNVTVTTSNVSFDIHCSKGTYIRSIARDLGKQLECGGHLSALTRTKQQQFLLNDAKTIDEIAESDLISLEDAFTHLNSLTLQDSELKIFLNGGKVETQEPFDVLISVRDSQGTFLGIGKNSSEGLKHEYLV